ncbi:MAG TPA: phage holin family protein [Noviherbaspirillum sp.]|nr:phage holin family protein [Noviherbaspirillum sp.]
MNEELKAASEIAKDPASYSSATYAWVLILAVWGGVVRIIREVKLGGKSWRQIILIFLAELTVSGFAGVNAFFLCESAGISRLYTAVLTSVASYMGGRALALFEEIYKARLGKGE